VLIDVVDGTSVFEIVLKISIKLKKKKIKIIYLRWNSFIDSFIGIVRCIYKLIIIIIFIRKLLFLPSSKKRKILIREIQQIKKKHAC